MIVAGGHSEADQGIHPDGDQYVVEQRDHRRRGHKGFERDRQIDDDQPKEDCRAEFGLVRDVGSPTGADHVGLDLVRRCADGAGDRVLDLAGGGWVDLAYLDQDVAVAELPDLRLGDSLSLDGVADLRDGGGAFAGLEDRSAVELDAEVETSSQ
jgi:hypothetical protein